VNAVRADHFHVLPYFISLHSSRRRSLRELIAPPGQEFEESFLSGDTPRRQFLVRSAGICGGLLDQFADVFPHSGNALLDLREVQRNVSHGSSPQVRALYDAEPRSTDFGAAWGFDAHQHRTGSRRQQGNFLCAALSQTPASFRTADWMMSTGKIENLLPHHD
jgi:hypothetical protein